MFCKKCGKEISDNSVFCKYCGFKQEDLSSLLDKPLITEDKAREHILFLFSAISRFCKWIWKTFLIKYWLISIGLMIVIGLFLILTGLAWKEVAGEDFIEWVARFWFYITLIVMLGLYVYNFRKWLYKK